MPDHLRQPHKNAMGPRSPAGSDSPLSLVIGRRDHHQHPHDHIIHNKTPPPQPFEPHHGSSSGFSEGDSPQDSPERPRDQDVELEQPLSLVVPKNISNNNNKIYDSGHDEDSSSPRSLSMAEDLATKENGLKIKDFAKYNLGEDARDKIPQHSEQALLAALTAPPKSKVAGKYFLRGSTNFFLNYIAEKIFNIRSA